MSSSEDFSNIVIRETVTQSQFSASNTLDIGTTYYWRITARNKCGSTLSLTQQFVTESTNSVQELDGLNVEIYPNPANDILNIAIESSLSIADLDVTIFSLDGKRWLHQNEKSSLLTRTVDISRLPQGVYLLRVETQHHYEMHRIVVQ